jgi:type IV secretory pathway VirB2 component (pilin)
MELKHASQPVCIQQTKSFYPPGRNLVILLALLAVLPATPALAQGGDEVAAAFTNIVTVITGIIQSLAVVVGVLGLSFWGFARIARPIFPELMNTTNQYINQFVIGLVAVYVAASVVEALAAAIGGATG